MAWMSINFNSKALKRPVVVDALIPQGHGGYKSLYLLHGAGGGHGSWLMKSRIADYVENTDIAVFMPSGDNKFYVDNVNGRDYHTFITEELVALCENWFDISRSAADRYIAGMSMGGYGAVYAALKKPKNYHAAFSYSGLLNILERYDNPHGLELFVPFGTRQELVDKGFDLYDLLVDKCELPCGNDGGQEQKSPSNAKNSLVDKYVDNVDNFCELVIECGRQDSKIHMSRQFHEAALNAGKKTIYYEEDGKHDFTYWDRCIERTIKYISRGGTYGSI